jgi:glycosyltransferase involved in cell wall biosynthesis
MKRLLVVAPYPFGKAPSQRFRFEQYILHLSQHGIETKVASFWSKRHWPAIYNTGGLALKIYATLEGFFRRFLLLFTLGRYYKVLIHREATPLGPPWWEWAAARVWKKTLIYDFDDAVWLPNNSQANEKLVKRLKTHSKTATIIKWCTGVMAGNAFLASYAAQYCQKVHVVPTTIDTQNHHNRVKKHKPGGIPVMGWTGSHSTLKQLTPLFPLLEDLHKQHPFHFLLISDEAPATVPRFVRFRKWNKAQEIDELLEMDFGIMPLYNTDWERGKCGFKALQYMALGMPAVVAAVGVNTSIVDEGINGYLCEPLPLGMAEAKWRMALTALLNDIELRSKMGTAARIKIEKNFSVEAYKSIYLKVLG